MFRIGFACKLSCINDGKVESIEDANFKVTTIAWMNRQTVQAKNERLKQITLHNIQALSRSLSVIAKWPETLRMFRIGSDILPMRTHVAAADFWDNAEFMGVISTKLKAIGDFARANNIRLSMHPGQFCVLGSESDQIVQNSIEEFEYHADVARMMGYGTNFQDFKINVHLSGKRGAVGFRESFARLSPVAQNCITIENDEYQGSVEDCISITDLCPVVLDVHHHFIHTGEYIRPVDSRVQEIFASWRGVRPVIHYSVSREDVLVGHATDTAPVLSDLLAAGHKKQKLRAHSDMMWNRAANQYIYGFTPFTDIMVESKHKNIASHALYKEFLTYV